MTQDHTLPPPTEKPDRPRSRTAFWSLLLLATSAVLLVSVLAMNRNDDPEPQTTTLSLPQQPLPNMRFVGVDGNVTALGGLQGKVVLIHFWGPWCTNCRIEMPEFHNLYQEFRQSDEFALLYVTCGPDLAAEDEIALIQESQQYLKEHQFDFPLFTDPYGASRRELHQLLFAKESALPYPLTVLVDWNGRAMGAWAGRTEGGLEEVRQLLAGELEKSRR